MSFSRRTCSKLYTQYHLLFFRFLNCNEEGPPARYNLKSSNSRIFISDQNFSSRLFLIFWLLLFQSSVSKDVPDVAPSVRPNARASARPCVRPRSRPGSRQRSRPRSARRIVIPTPVPKEKVEIDFKFIFDKFLFVFLSNRSVCNCQNGKPSEPFAAKFAIALWLPIFGCEFMRSWNLAVIVSWHFDCSSNYVPEYFLCWRKKCFGIHFRCRIFWSCSSFVFFKVVFFKRSNHSFLCLVMFSSTYMTNLKFHYNAFMIWYIDKNWLNWNKLQFQTRNYATASSGKWCSAPCAALDRKLVHWPSLWMAFRAAECFCKCGWASQTIGCWWRDVVNVG